MVVSFPVIGKSNTKYTFAIVKGKYYRNSVEITKEEYHAALDYFNANRKK